MKTTYLLLFALFSSNIYAQTNTLRCNPNVVLPKDSVVRNTIMKALDCFLIAAQKTNEENAYVYEKEKLETYILIDELKGVEKSTNFKDEHFYKPYLTNMVATKDSHYIVQISYIGTHTDSAFLKASFRLIVYKTDSSYQFSSLLMDNRSIWKTISYDKIVFHYKNHINKSKTKEFYNTAKKYDAKLRINNKVVEYYCCKDIFELQNLIGLDYKADYNSSLTGVSSVTIGDRRVVMLGNNKSSFENFDKHDLWHDRMSLILPRSKANRSIDEGCAYLYGGSWGMSWDEIYKAFKEQILINKTTNWVDIKETPLFFKTKEFNNSADYIISALLIKKIEKEKGFEAVWDLLKIGPSEKGNDKFYQTLERILGVKKENYNEFVWQLINSDK